MGGRSRILRVDSLVLKDGDKGWESFGDKADRLEEDEAYAAERGWSYGGERGPGMKWVWVKQHEGILLYVEKYSEGWGLTIYGEGAVRGALSLLWSLTSRASLREAVDVVEAAL